MSVKIKDSARPGGPRRGVEITVGTTFYGSIGACYGLMLRTFDSIVYLTNPDIVWRVITENPEPRPIGPEVRNYEPVDVTITVERGAGPCD